MALWLPDPRLERPEMLFPGRKPTGPVKINWQHPLAQHLTFAPLIRSGVIVDLATGLHGAAYSGNPVIHHTGAGEVLHSSVVDNKILFETDNLVISETRPFTLFLRYMINADVDNKHLLSLKTSSVSQPFIVTAMDNATYGDITFGRAVGAPWYVRKVSVIGDEEGQWRTIAIVFNGSVNSYSVYDNGASVSVSFSGNISANTNGTCIGGWYSSGNTLDGEIEFVYFFDNIAMTAGQVRSVTRNPYQFLIPSG